MPGPIRIKSTRFVSAPADQVYDILADYHTGHPQILPARVFRDLRVETGGQGAGTVIKFGMKSFGTVRWARAEVDEPEPGRVLRERVLDDLDQLDPEGIVTTFTVDRVEAHRSEVTIET
ncbi:MAG TPA: SRPBCC family protein, partial [Longimicrobiales bacterium]|nr:SRPBCC family protein [Longimicrobiales bacterium]